MALSAAARNARSGALGALLQRIVAVSAIVIGLVLPAAAEVVSFDGLNGQLGFGVNYEKETISDPALTQHLDRLYFDQRLGLRTLGSIYDPALARFHAGVDVGFFEDELKSESLDTATSRSGDGRLTGYDLRLGLLSDQPYNIDFFGQRSETNSRRDFAGRTETDLDRFGAVGRLQNLPLRSTVTVEQQQVQQRFTLLPTTLQQDETRRTASYYGERRDDASTLTADYQFEDITDRARGHAAFQIHTAGVNHSLQFGEYLDDLLGSSLRLYRREGTISTTNLLLRENAQLRHSQSLSSSYGFAFSLFDSGHSRSIGNNLIASLQHQYYRSLGSGLYANFSYTDLSPGTSLGGGTGFSTGYRKTIFWNGAFLTGFSAAYQINDQSVPAGRLSVFQESHQFPNGDPVMLDNPDIIDSTILVTDSTGTTTFAQGIDYTTERIGRRTFLRRNSTGRIEAGQTVLVSYDFQASQSLRMGSRPISFNGGLDFDWIHLFYLGERLRQDVFVGDPGAVLGPVDTDTAGMEIRLPLRFAEAFFTHEYVIYDAVDLRYKAYTMTQAITMTPHRTLTVAFTANQGFFNFSLPDRTRRSYTARWSMGWRPFGTLLFDGFIGLRNQRETEVPTEQFMEGGARSSWRIGLFTLLLTYDHEIQDIGETDRVGDLVRFQITRWF